MKIVSIFALQLLLSVITFAIAFTLGVALNLNELSIVTFASLMSTLTAALLVIKNKEVFNV